MKKRFLSAVRFFGIFTLIAGQFPSVSAGVIFEDSFEKPLQVVAVQQQGELLAVGGATTEVSLFSLPNELLVRKLSLQANSAEQIAFSPSGRRIAVGTGQGTVEIFDSTSGEFLSRVPCASTARRTPKRNMCDGQILLLNFLAEEELQIVAANTISVWTIASDRQMILEFSPTTFSHDHSARAASATKDGSLLIVGFQKSKAKVFKRNAGGVYSVARERVFDTSSDSPWVSSVAIRNDGEQAIVVLHPRATFIWDIGTDQIVRNGNANGASAYSPKGRVFAIARDNILIELRDSSSGEIVKSVNARKGIRQLLFTPDSEALIGVEASGTYTALWLHDVEDAVTESPRSITANAERIRADGERARVNRGVEARKQKDSVANIKKFRGQLKVESETNCGPVLELRGSLLKIYSPVKDYGNEHWIKRGQIFPPDYPCSWINGLYRPPHSW